MGQGTHRLACMIIRVSGIKGMHGAVKHFAVGLCCMYGT